MRQFLASHGLKYVLEKLEKLVEKALPVFTGEIELVDGSVAEVRELFDLEVEFVKSCIRKDTLLLKEERGVRAYVGLYQEALMLLAGRLCVSPKAAPDGTIAQPTKNMVELKGLIFQEIDELLGFLETSHSGYFDMGYRVQAFYLKIVSEVAGLAAGVLRNRLCAVVADHRLVDLAMLPSRQVVSAEGHDVPYRIISNLRFWHRELSRLLEAGATGPLDTRLRVLLHSVNFNYADFFDYCKQEVTAQLAGVDSVEKQTGILVAFRNYIQDIQVRSGLTFDMAYGPLDQSLLLWVTQKIDNLERDGALNRIYPPSTGKPKPAPSPIPFDGSTNELAAFVGGWVKTKRVPEGHRTRLAEVFAANFQTNNSERIDWENFRKKTYEPSPGVRDEVTKFLDDLKTYMRGDTPEKKPK